MKDLAMLIVLFHIKHFICDYPLQTRWMLGKMSDKPEVWLPALGAHACVHAIATLLIGTLWMHGGGALPLWLACIDYWTHFAIDRVKASPKLCGRWKHHEPAFWNALGLDQAAHHLVHLLLAYMMC